MPQLGFAINEGLALATLATGICWLAWQRQRRRHRDGEAADKPLWVRYGAELFVVVALMFGCRVALADWPKVPSGSMEPTLRVGDYLLVDHLAYGPRLPFTNTAIEFGQPKRGDVVVFRYPGNVSEFYVKRLIGLPGDVVRFDRGVVSVDGVPTEVERLDDAGTAVVPPEDRGQYLLSESAAGSRHTIKVNPFVMGRLEPLGMGSACAIDGVAAWHCTVPPGDYLMMGDNRDNSADSRVWGFLPKEQVYGKAVRVLFNLHDWKRAWTAL